MTLRRRVLAVTAAALLVVGACGGDDDDRPDEDTAATSSTVTTTPPTCGGPAHGEEDAPDVDSGGLDIPEVPGACPVPLVALGLGLAVPLGWDATLLDDDALNRVAEAQLVRPAFLASARAWAESGAVFYAAGVAEDGSVSDLKVYVEDGVDTSPTALTARADALVESGELNDASVAGDPTTGRVRVDFTVAMPSAEDPDTEIDGVGSELMVADGDRLWRFIVISESAQAQNAVLLIFDSSITFDG